MIEFALTNVQEYFDEIKRHKNIILFGCGGKGREAVPILKKHGIEPAAVCDNDPTLWGQKFLNEYVIQKFDSNLAALEGCCVIITCTIIYATEIYNELTSRYPNMPVYHLCSPFKCESGLLPEEDLCAHRSELLETCALLEDEESQKIFRDTLDWKLTGNMLPLNRYPLGYRAYSFFDGAFIHTDEQSVYVDVGA
ncbi:MAG: hypothetical protein HDR27_00005, partial [Lachnospiraceae bacterium]|nr:hypothetical protein [Lachnospiraceae bacterium]